jgi:tetratricopeptide (TPR) repeat protein
MVITDSLCLDSAWTMVFDNYDDPSSFNLPEYFPGGKNGRILVTSRHSDSFALTKNGIMLEGLPRNDALHLLCKHSDITQTELNAEHGERIVERLGYHPLAITQAGSYIYSRKLKFNQFLRHYNRQRQRMSVLQLRPRISEYRKALSDSAEETTLNLFVTLELSFEQLLREDPAHTKSRCLTLFAFFDTTDLSELLLKTYYDRKRPMPESVDFGESLIAAVSGNGTSVYADLVASIQSIWDQDAFVDILSALCQMSLVQSWSRDDNGFCHLTLHPLVRDWIRLRTDHAAFENYSITVADILAETIRNYEVSVGANAFEVPLKIRQQILSQTQAYKENLQSLKSSLDADSYRTLYERLTAAEISVSSFLRDSGHLHEAEEIAYHLATWLEKEYGSEDHRTFAALQNLTHIFSNQGRYSMAEAIGRRVLPCKEKILGPDNLDTLRTLSSLAINLEKQGKYIESEDKVREVIGRKKRALGPEHKSTIFSMGNLGAVVMAQARYVEAEKILKDAIKSGSRVFGVESSFVLAFTSNLAFALAGQRRYLESETVRQQLICVQEKVYSPITPSPFNILSLKEPLL